MKIFSITKTKRAKRIIALFLLLNMVFQVVSPTMSFALTSGPGQPEFSSFEPATTTDLVDLSTGDFNYNIPLLSVPGPNGGYPINLAYHSGIGMEEEASWVGLGWNVNVGAITRQLRGLPDDFNGEKIKQTFQMKPNYTFGLTVPKANDKHEEYFGFPLRVDNPTIWTWQLYYNNYKGLGYRVSTSFPRQKDGKSEESPLGLDLNYDSQQGIGADATLSLGKQFGDFEKGGFGFSFKGKLSMNSRQGVQDVAFSSSISAHSKADKIILKYGKNGMPEFGKGKHERHKGAGFGGNSTLSFGFNSSIPQVSLPTKTTSFNLNVKIGKAGEEVHPSVPVFGAFFSKYPKNWEGFSSITNLVNNGVVENPAVGYLYTDDRTESNVLKDFSRDDIPYSKKVPNLATSSFTHDLYLQTGQGTSSMFRPYFNKIALLNSPSMSSKEAGYTGNVEVGVSKSLAPTALAVHVGLGFSRTSGENYSGKWADIGQPDIADALKPNYFNSYRDYESSYFQVYGDNAGVLPASDQLESFGGDESLRVVLSKADDDNWLNRQFKVENQFVSGSAGAVSVTLGYGNKTRSQRQKRSTYIQALNNLNASNYGYSKTGVQYYNYNSGTPGTAINKSFPANAQMSEYTVIHADGMKYVYGLPSMNNLQIDNTFALKYSHETGSSGSGTSNSDFNTLTVDIPQASGNVDVSGTRDEFLSKTENNNSYAHSWMLTSVLSNDYIDLSGDGPSIDDYGYWVKFRYNKTSSDYKWRIPYKDANLFIGLNGIAGVTGVYNDQFDDKGSYSYGAKELHYLASIETKTHVAIFSISLREDAVGAKDELNGGLPSSILPNSRSYKLDKITLYEKNSNVPVKEVHFEYTYELCPGVPNNTGTCTSYTTNPSVNINRNKGKLTLKKVWFTYQTSTKGSLSPYVFDYGDTNNSIDGAGHISSTSNNPVYDLHYMDRWGNYKDVSDYIALNGGSGSNKYQYNVFPYTEQDNPLTDPAKWTLRKITLPTRATMEIEYEQDDYAYVEGNQATRMFDIMGIGDNCPLLHSAECMSTGVNNFSDAGRTSPNLTYAYTEARVSGSGGGDNDAKIYFRLETPVSTGASVSAEINKYISGLKDKMIYFKTYANLKNNYYDYVEGYAKLSSNASYHGLAASPDAPSGYYDLGYITLEPVPLNTINVTGIKLNPLTRAAIEHLRINRPEFIHESNPNTTSFTGQIGNLIGSIAGAPQDLLTSMYMFNQHAFNSEWGKKIQLNGASIIRLCDPDLSKKGGGIRVHKISIDDQWSNNSSGTPLINSKYGLEYEYTKNTSSGNTISSGVAYEPQIGGNESALRSPKNYSQSTLLASTSHLYVENPVMENFYPGASVVYSKVTVRSIAKSEAYANDNTNQLKHSSVPATIYEFYTPKDFPVIVDETDLTTDPAIVRPIIIPGVFSGFKKRKARSQGYSVVLNDMSGKLRSTTRLVEATGLEVSKETYIYYTENEYNPSGGNRLSSKVQVLNNNGTYQTAILGQSHDIYIDNHENYQKSKSRGLDVNLDLYFAAPAIPVFFIMPFPTIANIHTSMRTIVTTKVISRAGILKKVITKNDKSVIESESIAFDIETGQAVLSKTTNEFHDPVYSFNFPGHWYYPNMKGKYINTGFYMEELGGSIFSVSSCGQLDYSLFSDVPSTAFIEGDQVYVDCGSSSPYNKIYTVFAKGTGYIRLIDDDGVPLSSSANVASIKVVGSGYENQQSESVGSVSAMETNVSGYTTSNYQGSATAYTYDKILDASAITMSDNWQTVSHDSLTACGFTPAGAAFINMLNDISSTNLNTQLNTNILLYDYTTGVSYHGYDPVLSISPYDGTYSIYLYITSGAPGFYTWTIGAMHPTGLDPICQFQTEGYGPYNIPVSIDQESCSCFMENPTSIAYTAPCFTRTFGGWAVCSGNERIMGDTTGMEISNTCFPMVTINSCYNLVGDVTMEACGESITDIVNPYRIGIKGIWRPKHAYAYHSDRTQSDNIKTDGVYTDFTQFPWNNPGSASAKWIRSSTVTKYSPYGFEIENKDAIGNYSAAVYGYNSTLVTAIGSNSRYTEIAFDGFEDYPSVCADDHFKLTPDLENYVSTAFAHSGVKSVKVAASNNEDIFVSRKIVANQCSNYTLTPNCSNPLGPYQLSECDFIGKFGPFISKKYVLSAWVKDDYGTASTINVLDYTRGTIKVDFLNSVGTSISSATFNAAGSIIDGWQRVYGLFSIPSGTVDIKVIYKCSTGTSYFDDIRIHPSDANMVSYVYDPLTDKLLAELDENNYATFYNYDNEGSLVKVRKETTKGTKTIKEGRANPKMQ